MKRTLPFLTGAALGSGATFSFKQEIYKPDKYTPPTLEHPEFNIKNETPKMEDPDSIHMDDGYEISADEKRRYTVLISRMVGGICIATGHTLLEIADNIERTKKE